MRILQVNKFLYRRGGAEGYMLDLAELQRERGHEVEFFGMDHPENEPQTYREHFPSRVEFEPPPATLAGRVEAAGRMMWSTSAARGIREVIDRFAPDVVHLHNIYHQLSPSVVRAAARAGVPTVMTLHDYKLVCPTYQFLDQGRICTACIDGGPLTAARRRCKGGSFLPSALAGVEVATHRLLGAYDSIGALVCPSGFLRDRLAEAGVGTGRLVQLDNFTDLTVEPRVGAGEGAAVYAGRLSPEKGVDTLVEAAGLLAERHPGTVLHIAGDGPERESLERLASERAPGAVRFHGRLSRPDLVDLLRRSRVAVVPSRWLENMPLSVLEAQALGVPVVASALGGLVDLVDDGVDGSLVPADDPAALAAAVDPYLRDDDLTARRGRAARTRVENAHDPAGHAAAVDDIYARVGAVVVATG